MRRESRHSGRHGRAVDDGEAFFGCRLIGAMPASSRATSALFTLLAPSTSRGPVEAVADDLPSITAPIHASALRSPDAEMLDGNPWHDILIQEVKQGFHDVDPKARRTAGEGIEADDHGRPHPSLWHAGSGERVVWRERTFHQRAYVVVILGPC